MGAVCLMCQFLRFLCWSLCSLVPKEALFFQEKVILVARPLLMVFLPQVVSLEAPSPRKTQRRLGPGAQRCPGGSLLQAGCWCRLHTRS